VRGAACSCFLLKCKLSYHWPLWCHYREQGVGGTQTALRAANLSQNLLSHSAAPSPLSLTSVLVAWGEHRCVPVARHEQSSVFTMAPHLAASQHELIHDMILSKSLKQVDMAAVAGCSDRSIRAILQSPMLRQDKSTSKRCWTTTTYDTSNT
jgi:hypothetical protein